MLVLTRKVDERFYIGDDIVITVIAVRGESTVKIGIEAPRHIQVEREELRQAPLKNYMEKRS